MTPEDQLRAEPNQDTVVASQTLKGRLLSILSHLGLRSHK